MMISLAIWMAALSGMGWMSGYLICGMLCIRRSSRLGLMLIIVAWKIGTVAGLVIGGAPLATYYMVAFIFLIITVAGWTVSDWRGDEE